MTFKSLAYTKYAEYCRSDYVGTNSYRKPRICLIRQQYTTSDLSAQVISLKTFIAKRSPGFSVVRASARRQPRSAEVQCVCDDFRLWRLPVPPGGRHPYHKTAAGASSESGRQRLEPSANPAPPETDREDGFNDGDGRGARLSFGRFSVCRSCKRRRSDVAARNKIPSGIHNALLLCWLGTNARFAAIAIQRRVDIGLVANRADPRRYRDTPPPTHTHKKPWPDGCPRHRVPSSLDIFITSSDVWSSKYFSVVLFCYFSL